MWQYRLNSQVCRAHINKQCSVFSLNFAIGTVQDAGLIFLSAMSNQIADSILSGGGTIDEVVSTTLVVLPLGTAALGIVLIFLGKFKLLAIVSYLPMPVIGGYLAFIGKTRLLRDKVAQRIVS